MLLLLPIKTPKGGTNFTLTAQEHENRQGQNKKPNSLGSPLSYQQLTKHNQQSLRLKKLLTKNKGRECSNVEICPFVCIHE